MFNLYFYPRSPCGERPHHPPGVAFPTLFLSTLSLRRATISGVRHKCAIFYFYPRSPCGERLYLVRGQRPSWGISIHALLAESDCTLPRQHAVGKRSFLSTLSLRRATLEQSSSYNAYLISIHALLAESDSISVHEVFANFISIHALLAESDC